MSTARHRAKLEKLCKTRDVAERDGDGWVDCQCGSKHWGRFGAAGLLLIQNGRVLLQHRAPWVHNGDTWGIPGGARDSHEDGFSAALREASEEIGIATESISAHFSHLEDHGDWSYETIVVIHRGADFEFEPNHETQDIRWFPIDEIESVELHPSFARSWPEISARILEISDEDVSGTP